MPLQEHHKLISVDDHIIEPPDVWSSRVPNRYKELAPRVVERTGMVKTNDIGVEMEVDHVQMWQYESELFPSLGLNAVAGRPREEWGMDPVRFEQMRPGCYDPHERVKDMDADGVQAQLGFPSFPGFAGRTFLQAKDRDLALICVQAYNDFNIDEWCGSHPDRLIPLVILPLWDPQLAALELSRTISKGARAVAFPENPAGLGLPSLWTDHWDPIFGIADEAGIALSMHFGTSTQMPYTSPDAPFLATIPLMGTNSMSALSEIIFSTTLHKFPGLKIALAEGGIGWIPWLLARMDYSWERHRHYHPQVDQHTLPSELFRRNIWGCFIDDIPGVALRHEIGLDRLTWESDYPHSDSAWPDSRKRAAEVFADIPDDEVRQIVELNARELLKFDADLKAGVS